MRVQLFLVGSAVCWKGAVPDNLCGFAEGGRGLFAMLYASLLTLQYIKNMCIPTSRTTCSASVSTPY